MRTRHSYLEVIARLGAVTVLCTIFLALSFSVAFASETATRTAADIQARWQQLMPVYSGSPYAVAPSTRAPYAAGSITSGMAQDGLNALNYCRYLAGLPDDVTIDSADEGLAQDGAVLLAASTYSHTPPKPSDMDQAFYALGYKATSSSNIGIGYSSLANFTFDCMDDSDPVNIDRLGHRRWILDPPLAKTGMGWANQRCDTYVFDWSRTTPVSYDSIKWPAAGAFPAEMTNEWTPWSVTLNPALYSMSAGTAGYRVTLRREGDGKTWTFTGANTDTSGQYFNFETSRYGINNCFIFRPDPASVGGYEPGDVFDVTITGPITNLSDGTPATISYVTDFISQDGPTTSIRLSGAARVKAKRTYKLAGWMAPSDASGRVRISLKRYAGGKWRPAGSKTVSVSNGKFRYSFKPKHKGKWQATARLGSIEMASVSTRHTTATKRFKVK